jgi:hypothetical protein
MAFKMWKRNWDRRKLATRNLRNQTLYFTWLGWNARDWDAKTHRAELELRYQKWLDRSQYAMTHGGTKAYKRVYHRRRRAEAARLCYFGFIGDEQAFERISPEGFRGAIRWDIW